MLDFKRLLRILKVCELCKNYEPNIPRHLSMKCCRFCVQDITPEMIAELKETDFFDSEYNIHFVDFEWISPEIEMKYTNKQIYQCVKCHRRLTDDDINKQTDQSRGYMDIDNIYCSRCKKEIEIYTKSQEGFTWERE